MEKNADNDKGKQYSDFTEAMLIKNIGLAQRMADNMKAELDNMKAELERRTKK